MIEDSITHALNCRFDLLFEVEELFDALALIALIEAEWIWKLWFGRCYYINFVIRREGYHTGGSTCRW